MRTRGNASEMASYCTTLRRFIRETQAWTFRQLLSKVMLTKCLGGKYLAVH